MWLPKRVSMNSVFSAAPEYRPRSDGGALSTVLALVRNPLSWPRVRRWTCVVALSFTDCSTCTVPLPMCATEFERVITEEPGTAD
jgi:hypothetical protein